MSVCPKESHLSSKVWGINIPVVSPLDLLELPWPWWSFIDSCCIVYNSGCVLRHLWMEVLYHPGINWFLAAKHAEWFPVFTGTKPKTACFCSLCCSIALLCFAMALHQFSHATNKSSAPKRTSVFSIGQIVVYLFLPQGPNGWASPGHQASRRQQKDPLA